MTGKMHSYLESKKIEKDAYKLEWMPNMEGLKILRRGGATGGGGRPAKVGSWTCNGNVEFVQCEWIRISHGVSAATAKEEVQHLL